MLFQATWGTYGLLFMVVNEMTFILGKEHGVGVGGGLKTAGSESCLEF